MIALRLPLALLASGMLLGTPDVSAQSYLPRHQMVGGNPGPAHNYVCPNVTAPGTAIDCYLDAVAHLYRMCKHVKSIEIIEHGYEQAEAGTNSSKSEYCVAKQKGNIARPYQAALGEAKISRQAVEALRALHEYWGSALAALKWRAGESDDDYTLRTANVFLELNQMSEAIRSTIIVARDSAPPTTAARGKPTR